MDAEPPSFKQVDTQPTLLASTAPLMVEAMPHSQTLAQQCTVAAKQLTPQLPPTQLLYRVMGGNGASHLINEVTDDDLHDLIVDELPELSRELSRPGGNRPPTVPQAQPGAPSA